MWWAAAPDLQVEAGTLWHGTEGGDGGHAGEGAHQDEDAPAVKLVCRAHLEAPACERHNQPHTNTQLKTAPRPTGASQTVMDHRQGRTSHLNKVKSSLLDVRGHRSTLLFLFLPAEESSEAALMCFYSLDVRQHF